MGVDILAIFGMVSNARMLYGVYVKSYSVGLIQASAEISRG